MGSKSTASLQGLIHLRALWQAGFESKDFEKDYELLVVGDRVLVINVAPSSRMRDMQENVHIFV